MGKKVDDDTLELVSFETGTMQLVAPVSTAPVSSVSQQGPIKLATIAAASPGGPAGPSEKSLAALANAPGDEWEYLATDEMFGKKQKLVLRVKAASAEGLLEEIIWNGKSVLEWVFGPQFTAIGSPNEANFLFSPYWDGSVLSNFRIEGGNSFCTGSGQSCQINVKISGTEKLTIAAGTFDAVRLDGWVTLLSPANRTPHVGRVTIWYSNDQRRLLKQSAEASGAGGFIPSFKETLELAAIRLAPR